MDIVDNIRSRLEVKGVHEIRQIGRAVGVSFPTKKKKGQIIEEIVAIAKCELAPCPRSTRGAPPKSEEYDEALVADVVKSRDYFSEKSLLVKEGEVERESDTVAVRCDEEEDKVYSGILEYTDKFWFVRTKNMEITSGNDVFVHVSFVNRFRLRAGDHVVCKARRRKEGECPGANFIVSVNGRAPGYTRSDRFENLTPCYPDRRVKLEYEGCTLTNRVIDLFSPIGFGQRALIVSPPKAGKTTMLKSVAQAICRNHPETKVIILLIDERPEEVTDIKRSVDGAEVYYSTFDKGDVHHTHTAALALEYAKRQVELGKDVVILLDSITRLTRSHNSLSNSGRILSGGLDPQALVEPKRFFGAARNIEGGGSLTIVGTVLVDTGSRLDDVIYEEFKSTGNMEIVLSRALAERRVFPALDIRASGARKEELLLSESELDTGVTVRGMLAQKMSEEELYAAMKKTESNEEFCNKSQAFLRVYNGR